MKRYPSKAITLFILISCACAKGAPPSGAANPVSEASPLAGSWALVAADVIHPDGKRDRDFGASPTGMLVIDRNGRYALQIYKAERPLFASGDKQKGTGQEYVAAVMGSSTHFGTVEVDPIAHKLSFHIKSASFPNWEGQVQTRGYTLDHDVLTYRLPPRPNGDIALSSWRRIG